MNLKKWIDRRLAIWQWCHYADLCLNGSGKPRTTYLNAPPEGYEKYPRAVALEAKRQEILAMQRQKEQQRDEEAQEKFRAACALTDPMERYAALDRLPKSDLRRLSSEDQQWYREQVQHLAAEQADVWLEEARSGNVEAFLNLHRFTKNGKHGLPSEYEALTGEPYVTPRGWNHMVAQLFMTPSLSYFREVPRQLSYEQYQLMVASALQRSSLVDAKILLAHSERWPKASNRAGELAELIVNMHNRLELFPGALSLS